LNISQLFFHKNGLSYQRFNLDQMYPQIVNLKIDIKAESKVGSLDNVGHKPGGGEKKIYDDKEYLKQIEHPIPISPQPQVNIK
jgi:Tau and MAP protein, tubulin-binding repeat